MFDARVLGVDPGVAKMGLAVVARRGRMSELIWAGAVSTPSGEDEPARLLRLVEAMRRAIHDHAPTAVAIERVAFSRNVVSALTVARATGALLVVAGEAGLSVREYTPTEVKSAVTGVGHADKDQVRAALTRVHGLKGVPTQPDAADAVAVAVTHLSGARLQDSVARSEALQ